MSTCDKPSGHPAVERTPALRVVRGTPTPEELAALVGVLFSPRRPATTTAAPPPAASRWARSGHPAVRLSRTTAIPPHRGPDAWRTSALPL